MDLLKKANVFISAMAVLLTVSCGGNENKHDDPAPQVPAFGNKTCLPVSSYSAGTDGENEYLYNAAGQVTRINSSYRSLPNASYKLIGYNNKGQVYKVVNYQTHPAAFYLGYELLTYTSDSLLTKVTHHGPLVAGDTTTMQTGGSELFEYDTQKRLTKISLYSGGQPDMLLRLTTFSYLPDGKMLETNYGKDHSQLYYTRLYTFNNHKAPGGTLAYFNVYQNKSSYSDNIIFGRLPENIIEKNYAPGNTTTPAKEYTFTYTYTFNADGYPTAQTVTVTGRPGQGPITHAWTYNCQ